MKLLRSNRGDTIVEVLISMAIASFVLGGAYALVNRTLANSQQAQEHSEALKIAEGQLEQLKGKQPTLVGTNVFCYSKDDNSLVPFPGALSVPATEADYEDPCKAIGIAGYYRVAVLYNRNDASNPYDDLYTAYVRWPGPTGGNDEVSLSYRVHP